MHCKIRDGGHATFSPTCVGFTLGLHSRQNWEDGVERVYAPAMRTDKVTWTTIFCGASRLGQRTRGGVTHWYHEVQRRRRFKFFDVMEVGLSHYGPFCRVIVPEGWLLTSSDASCMAGNEIIFILARKPWIGVQSFRTSGMPPRRQMCVGPAHVANTNSNKRRDRSPFLDLNVNPGGVYDMDH